MLNPPLNQLTAKINSKYLIATTAAKRARELDENTKQHFRKLSFS